MLMEQIWGKNNYNYKRRGVTIESIYWKLFLRYPLFLETVSYFDNRGTLLRLLLLRPESGCTCRWLRLVAHRRARVGR